MRSEFILWVIGLADWGYRIRTSRDRVAVYIVVLSGAGCTKRWSYTSNDKQTFHAGLVL